MDDTEQNCRFNDLEDVFKLYKKYSSKNYKSGKITQLDHSLQMALQAEQFFKTVASNVQSEVILAAFLKNIGYLLQYESWFKNDMVDFGYKKIGAIFLSNLGFPDTICKLLATQTVTQRYIITKKKGYFNLSEESKKNFEIQGGELDYIQMRGFEKEDLFYFHLKLNEWNNQAENNEPEFLNTIRNINPETYFQKYIDDIKEKCII